MSLSTRTASSSRPITTPAFASWSSRGDCADKIGSASGGPLRNWRAVMPRLCANLKWLFTELPFLDRFDAAAKAGFSAVEYASPYEYAAGDLRSRLKDCGLKQVLINTPAGDPADGGGSGLACVPGQQGTFRDGLKRAFDYASALDCGLVHV